VQRSPDGGHDGARRRRLAELTTLARDHEAFRDLVRFALSDDYFVLREKIGAAVANAAVAA
jgi:hypothetical protein